MAKQAIKSKGKTTDEQDFIRSVVDQIDTKYGKGTALLPNSDTMLCKVDHWVSTRNFIIDSAIAGGLPMPRPIIPFGRLTTISGKNGTGKTSLLGHIIAETQATGGIAAILDTEQALDLAYFEKLGVDLSRLIVVQADYAEEVFSKMETLINVVRNKDANKNVCIAWDSLGGTPTKAQFAAEADDKFYAEMAKVVGQNLQRTVTMISKQRVGLVFTNHVYTKMNVQWGDELQEYGGEKVQFYSTLRIRLHRVGAISEKVDGADQTIGHRVKVEVKKNKMAPILRKVVVPCLGNYGFSMDYSVLEQGMSQGVIKGTTWKTWTTPKGEEVKFQGWRGFREKVMPHAEYKDLVREVVENYNLKATAE